MAMVGECCAARVSNESRNWALVQFGEAQLGDKRRTRRLVQLAAAITEDPSMSLPKQLPAWSDLVGAYRLLSNAQVDPQAILQPHLAWTLQQAQGYPVVLCVQDDTQLDFGGRIAAPWIHDAPAPAAGWTGGYILPPVDRDGAAESSPDRPANSGRWLQWQSCFTS